ncbi:MAG: DNA repair protein RecN [Lachnospiraceae bacterium]|nr:DNA repair protein RecN [Lachnospiraceae bacterium]
MLEEIKVKNVALISEAQLCPGSGLNILTGETGAGKSILIDSIFLALGARADKGLIRQGADHAYVELAFTVEDKALEEKLSDAGAYAENGRIVLARRIEKDRNICRINGELVSGKVLRQAGSLLIDIHSQNEHTQLAAVQRQLEIIDEYCQDKLKAPAGKLEKLYEEYRLAEAELDEAKMRQGHKDRDIDLYRYELAEIEAANLTPGEDEELEGQFHRLSNLSKITGLAYSAKSCIDDENTQCALTMVGNAIGSLREAQRYDESLGAYADALLEAEENLRETARDLSRFIETTDRDEDSLSQISDRLDVINRLKTKYAQTIEGILKYGDEKRELLEKLENFDRYIEELEKKKDKLKQDLLLQCEKVSGIRKRGAKDFSKRLKSELSDLGFEYVSFDAEVASDERYLSKDGYDRLTFMISLNPGQSDKPLSEVASGGEMSRIMLAIKTVMADTDAIPTLIFDEIDAGISGQTAWKVSEKMALIGRRHQLLCITHLPQIAAMADNHFMIEKSLDKKETKTGIMQLEKEGMIGEIARLLGSDEITDSALENARQLKKQADEVKAG